MNMLHQYLQPFAWLFLCLICAMLVTFDGKQLCDVAGPVQRLFFFPS